MIRLELREGDPWLEAELTSSQAARLAASDVIRVAPGPRLGLWHVRDNGYIGAARIGGDRDSVELRIEPKVQIDRVLFLVGYARRQRGWRLEEVDAAEAGDLLPALAYAFARAAERAVSQGVLLGYRATEEALPVLRGRIREAEQMRRRQSMLIPVEVRYDDYTADIAENRLLLSATQRLLRLPGIPAPARRLLRHIPARLVGVERLNPGGPLPAWQPTRLNARYHTALGLAELVLRSASYELDDGRSVRVDGLLLRMWQVFEDFVMAALGDALRARGGSCHLQDKRHHLDRSRQVQLMPDLVYDQPGPDGREAPAAVIDAKYKIELGPGGQNPDLYQMLAYCTVLGLDRGHLVYAEGPAQPISRCVQRARIEIVQHALDLSVQPDDLLALVADLAADIAATRMQPDRIRPGASFLQG